MEQVALLLENDFVPEDCLVTMFCNDLTVPPSAFVLQSENWLSWAFEKLVIVMVIYFVLSIIHSMAQSYAKRVQQKKLSVEKTK